MDAFLELWSKIRNYPGLEDIRRSISGLTILEPHTLYATRHDLSFHWHWETRMQDIPYDYEYSTLVQLNIDLYVDKKYVCWTISDLFRYRDQIIPQERAIPLLC